jgi:excisionase family DNA binding protein
MTAQTLPEKDLLRPDEVAAYFGVSLRTIYYWLDWGPLERVKLSARATRITRASVLKMIKTEEEE